MDKARLFYIVQDQTKCRFESCPDCKVAMIPLRKVLEAVFLRALDDSGAAWQPSVEESWPSKPLDKQL